MGMDVFLGVYSCTPPSRESFNVTKSSSVWPCSVKAKVEVGCLLMSREPWTEFGQHTHCSSVPHSFLARSHRIIVSVCVCVKLFNAAHKRSLTQSKPAFVAMLAKNVAFNAHNKIWVILKS